MPNYRALITLAALLATGCVSPPNNPTPPIRSEDDRRAEFDQKLATWHGHDINELILKRGAPTSTYRMPNGNMIYTYTNSIVVPPLFGGMPMVLTCTVNYAVDTSFSLIVGHSFTGC